MYSIAISNDRCSIVVKGCRDQLIYQFKVKMELEQVMQRA